MCCLLVPLRGGLESSLGSALLFLCATEAVEKRNHDSRLALGGLPPLTTLRNAPETGVDFLNPSTI